MMPTATSDILLYQSPDGQIRLDVQLDQDTVWLSQAQMVELFSTTKQNVSLHTRNLFREGELQENAVVKDSLTTAADGKSYRTKHYNLDVIISVGYRVKSARGTSFRQWATQVLRVAHRVQPHPRPLPVGRGEPRRRTWLAYILLLTPGSPLFWRGAGGEVE